jgi:hypothetical protein
MGPPLNNIKTLVFIGYMYLIFVSIRELIYAGRRVESPGHGFDAYGIDNNPVAAAVSGAKMVTVGIASMRYGFTVRLPHRRL